MKPVKIGLLGLGTVGGGTATVLSRNAEEIQRRAGREIVISHAAAKEYNPEGIDGLDKIGGHDLFSGEERSWLLRDHGLVRPDVRTEVLTPFYDGLNTDAVNAALHGGLRSWLAESDLVRADRTAACAGLDLRYPLLDREVLELAAALPGESKLVRVRGSLHTRWPLRSMLRGTLPAPLLDRPKRGLPKPLDNWLEGPGRLFMEERFARLREDRHGLWRPGGLDQLRRDLARKRGAGIRLWTMLILDQWLASLERL